MKHFIIGFLSLPIFILIVLCGVGISIITLQLLCVYTGMRGITYIIGRRIHYRRGYE